MNTATLAYAETLGMIAFGKGRPPQPGGDTQLAEALREVGAMSRDGNALMRAWLKGWHTANLQAA
jgi:hypothetical protein